MLDGYFDPMRLKTTVFIPTIPNHFKYLENIVQTYNTGKVIPDEIIISAAMDNSDIHQLDHLKQYDNVRIEPYFGKLEVGPNRQRAKEFVDGGIILYQDSDDLPCKERVYWVRKFFQENSDISVLNHSYVFMGNEISDELLETYITVFSPELKKLYFPNNKYPDDARGLGCYGKYMSFPVHAGAVCIRRNVLDSVSWKRMSEYQIFNPLPLYSYKGAYAEDAEFCFDCIWKLNKSAIISLPLYYYRK
jgi:hypothetical protein